MNITVVGLGYVGLPLLIAMSRRPNYDVSGIDIDQSRVDQLSAGRSHVDDIDDDALRQALQTGRVKFTVSHEPLSDADVVVICVPTPLDRNGSPDISAVTSVVSSIAKHMSSGVLVVLESTTFPGTTEEVVRPMLESEGLKVERDFYLAFSPERVDPGNSEFGLENTPKVVGGVGPNSTKKAVEFYSGFVKTVVAARGSREAEMSKLLENTYRHINIALVNEMAKFCSELDVDIWNVIECASTKPFGFQAFRPGPGVGGHCIPIDPNYLSHTVKSRLNYPFRFVELAQEINASMPGYVARRVQDLLNDGGLALRGSRVLLLGVTYKPNIADQRESPAVPLAHHLIALGADVSYDDPYVLEWQLRDGKQRRSVGVLNGDCEEEFDVVVLVQRHSAYSNLSGLKVPILDTSGSLVGPNVVRL